MITQFTQDLKAKNLKVTPQRIAILSEIEANGHMDVDELYERIKEFYPSISLATIYKNISALCDANILREIKAPNHKQKYELACDKHIHVACEKCGKFEDLKIDTTKLGNIMTSINAAGNQSAKDDAKKTFEMILGAGKGEYVSASITQMSKDTFFHDLTTAHNTVNRTQNDAILTSLIGSSTNATIGMNAVANAGFFKDLESIAHSHTNTTSEQSSANATINIANDMASVAGSLEPTTHTNSKCVSRVC